MRANNANPPPLLFRSRMRMTHLSGINWVAGDSTRFEWAQKMRNPPGSFLNRAFQSFQVLFYIYYRFLLHNLPRYLIKVINSKISIKCINDLII